MILAVSGKLSRSCSSSDRETCWGQWYLLESRKKSENSCSCKSATPLVGFAGASVGKWAWPGGMRLDILLHTHSIFLSWDIIICMDRHSYSLIHPQSHSHLCSLCEWRFFIKTTTATIRRRRMTMVINRSTARTTTMLSPTGLQGVAMGVAAGTRGEEKSRKI